MAIGRMQELQDCFPQLSRGTVESVLDQVWLASDVVNLGALPATPRPSCPLLRVPTAGRGSSFALTFLMSTELVSAFVRRGMCRSDRNAPSMCCWR
jgi:hypothetical protein